MSTNYALKFLHNKQLGLSRNLVEELISTDEFSKEMMPYVSSGSSITPDLVLEVVTDIYISMKRRTTSNDFKNEFVSKHGKSEWDKYKHKFKVLQTAYILLKDRVDSGWNLPIQNKEKGNEFGFLYKIFRGSSMWLEPLCADRFFIDSIAPYINSNSEISAGLVFEIISTLFAPMRENGIQKEFREQYIKERGAFMWQVYKLRYLVYRNAYKGAKKYLEKLEKKVKIQTGRGV